MPTGSGSRESDDEEAGLLQQDLQGAQQDQKTLENKDLPVIERGKVQADLQKNVGDAAGIGANTKNPETAIKAAEGLDKLEQPDAAKPAADHAVALAEAKNDPALIDRAHVARGNIAFKQGDYQTANQDAAAALKANPRDKAATSLYNLTAGRVPLNVKLPKLAAQGPPGEAQAQQTEGEAHKGEAASPPQGPAQKLNAKAQAFAGRRKADEFTAQAEVKLKLKDYNEAFEQANRAINLQPNGVRARLARARASNGRGNYDGARSDAEIILKEDPDNAAALVERSYAMCRLGRFEEARKDATNALLIDPNNALAYYTRAQAEEKLGLAAQAQADRAKAERLDPALAASLDEPATNAQTAPPHPSRKTAASASPWIFTGTAALIAVALVLFVRSAAAT